MAQWIHAEEIVEQLMVNIPFANAATVANEDTLYFHQAMKTDDKKQFFEAIAKEILDYTEQQHWETVKYSQVAKNQNVVRGCGHQNKSKEWAQVEFINGRLIFVLTEFSRTKEWTTETLTHL